MVARRVVSVDAEGDAQFDRAFEFLKASVDLKQANERHPVRDNAVYTTAVVLWMLVYQRMNPDKSLEAAVKKLIDSKPAFLPDNKRVPDGTLSARTPLPIRWHAAGCHVKQPNGLRNR